jgi:hypothetical protein
MPLDSEGSHRRRWEPSHLAGPSRASRRTSALLDQLVDVPRRARASAYERRFGTAMWFLKDLLEKSRRVGQTAVAPGVAALPPDARTHVAHDDHEGRVHRRLPLAGSRRLAVAAALMVFASGSLSGTRYLLEGVQLGAGLIRIGTEAGIQELMQQVGELASCPFRHVVIHPGQGHDLGTEHLGGDRVAGPQAIG